MKISSKIKMLYYRPSFLLLPHGALPGCNGGGSGKEGTSDSTSTASTNGDDKTLLGAGSTFVYPIILQAIFRV